jgi:hypothetical protein
MDPPSPAIRLFYPAPSAITKTFGADREAAVVRRRRCRGSGNGGVYRGGKGVYCVGDSAVGGAVGGIVGSGGQGAIRLKPHSKLRTTAKIC